MKKSQPEAKYIPINKGHFELDTPERIEAFSKKLSSNWEAEYREYRTLWTELPNSMKVLDYPLLVDFEMSTFCNLKCPMCPRRSDEFRRRVPDQFMDFALFQKVIDEIAGKVFAVRLSLVGESTLHHRFVEAIAYAKKAGIREVSFLTNGSLLDLELFKSVSEAGADWITISIDGMGKEYERIRYPLKFDDTLTRLRHIHAYKTKRNLLKPVIKVQTVWPAIRSNPTAFYETIGPLVDLVAYNPLIDYLHKDTEIIYEEGFICPQLYQRVVICSNGKAKLCSNDEWRMVIVGDASRQTIHEIWHGERMSNARMTHHRREGFKTISACKMCYYPRKTTPNEKAIVGNREIWVENYLNRSQEIGE